MLKFIATLTVAGAMLVPGAATADDSGQRVRQYPSCPTEDSGNCVWQNEGPGFSFVSNRGPDGTSTRVYRVSDRLADRLVARHGSWRRVPDRLVGRRVDTTHGGSYRIGERTVISYGDTTYLINRRGQVGTS